MSALAGLAVAAIACSPLPAAPVGDSAPAVAEQAYDSNRQMYEVFPGFGLTSADTFVAQDRVIEQQDMSMVPVLVESMRFQSSQRARDATAETLETLTGLIQEGEPWLEWSNWLVQNRDAYLPPSEYLAWKIDIMSQIDPRFRLFLQPATAGEISVNPIELMWGGVVSRPEEFQDDLGPRSHIP